VVRRSLPSKQEKQKGKPGFCGGPLFLSGTIYFLFLRISFSD
jgi:hypothetical protein